MNILGIQKHNRSSACLFKNGELIYFNIEERLSKIKKDDGIPVECLKEILKIEKDIDRIVITGYNFVHDENCLVTSFVKKLGFNLRDKDQFFWYSYYQPHHISHAFNAFYNSNFKEALVIVCDGRGSTLNLADGSQAFETTSVYKIKHPTDIEIIYKRLYANDFDADSPRDTFTINNKLLGQTNQTKLDIRKTLDVGHAYEAISASLGFGSEECGKLMGLQSYGKYNPLFNDFVDSTGSINNNYFKFDGRYHRLNEIGYPCLQHKDNAIDLAHRTQKFVENTLVNLVDRMVKQTNLKNVILTGGVALNVLANYAIRKALPGDIKLYAEPICGDEGNCLGLSRLYCEEIGIKTTMPNHNYLNGLEPSYDFKLNDGETISEANPKDVIDLILQQNIVAIFQGKSESGPRALGNRSILFDPRNPNGKDIVNIVKNREAFRPFACSILKDEANKWFDMAGLDESPYMMYAMQAKPGVKDIIPSVVHVDNTCRIQTVKESDNKILFELLTEFNRQTGVPALFNTSFNLAGQVICETIDDALWTLRNSKIEYLYLPDINSLVTIKK